MKDERMKKGPMPELVKKQLWRVQALINKMNLKGGHGADPGKD